MTFTLFLLAASFMVIYAFQEEFYKFLYTSFWSVLPYLYAIATLVVVTYLCYFIVYKPVIN